MLIRIKKRTDGSAALSCLRDDGSVTWQRQEGIQGRFFPLHDLTHYAVETVLGHRRGFYGLVAEGWELTDFGTPWPRGPIPTDAERAAGVQWSAADCNAKAPGALALTDARLAAVRARRAELFALWHALPP